MEMGRRPITRTISKTPSTPQSRWPASENYQPGRSRTVTADNQHAENFDHRDCAAAEAHDRAAISATTATEAAVPGGLDGERQLLRTGLRQGAGPRFPGKVGVRPGGARAQIGKLRDRRPLAAPWRSWSLILRASLAREISPSADRRLRASHLTAQALYRPQAQVA